MRVAKRGLLIFFAMLLALSSLSQMAFAVEKKDSRGEVLNLPPFVDFEVTEKRKVDVIVDVGNTMKSMNQVNSWVNEALRPKLQAAGLDYTIHVEKSSEGASKVYYFTMKDTKAKTENELRYYDVITGEDKLVRSLNGVTQYTPIRDVMSYDRFSKGTVNITNGVDQAVYDPEKEVIYLKGRNSYNTRAYVYDLIHDIFYQLTVPRFIYSDTGSYIYPSQNEVVIQTSVANNETGGDEAIAYFTVNRLDDGTLDIDLTSYRETIVDPRMMGADGYSFRYVTNKYLELYASGPSSKVLSGGNDRTQNVAIRSSVDSVPGFSIFVEKKAYNDNTAVLRMFDHTTKQISTLAEGVSSTKYSFYALEDGRIFYKGMDGKQYVIEDRFNPQSTTKQMNVSLPIAQYKMLGTLLVSEQGLDSSSTRKIVKTMNVDTYETKTIIDKTFADAFYINSALKTANYAPWFKTQRRTIQDIVNEGIYRADADKYYVRIDDYDIYQLTNPKMLAETASTLLRENVTYIGLGNANSKGNIESLIQTLSGVGRYIDNTDMLTALETAGSTITDRIEVDLHILMADAGVSESALQTEITNLKAQLQKENILLMPHYVRGSTTSTLYELLNRVNWRDDVNNYVLFLHQGSMAEFNDPLVEEEITLLLGGHYAFYTAMGSSRNKSVNESLIASNLGNGYFFSGTNINYFMNQLATFIEGSAVKNPKRVSDTLVLNYDRTTGEYSSEVLINTYYEDFESDPKINERFRTTHDPTVYENNTGVMEGIGQFQSVPTTVFTKVGRYEMIVQVQDDPTRKPAFTNYNLWSQDSLSRLVLYVHRAPVAEFAAIVNKDRSLTIREYSYDLDRYSQRNKGVTQWVWKWKRFQDEGWTDGYPPSQLAANTDYFISLKVKDIDGAWSSELIKFVTTNPYNMPPVAFFTVDPQAVSWSKTAKITDQSYDPDGDPIVAREWEVYRDQKYLFSSSTTPTVAQIKQAAQAAGLDPLGKYKLSLRVKDNPGLWSDWYSDYLEIVNFAPVADFEPLDYTYRDTINTIINTTPNPDQDGDPVSFQWTLSYGDKSFNLGSAVNPTFKIKDRGLGKNAIGTWLIELKATDPLGATSYMTRSFEVLNHTPTTEITSGRNTGYINEPYTYTSSRHDEDTEDVASLESFWKLTSPSGKVRNWYDQNITITYDEKGKYLLENWVVDQLGAKSEVDSMEITILNLLPIPGFTMNPNPTYRGVDVDVKSTATDYDGYIDAHQYYVTLPNGTTTMITSFRDFVRAFNTVGTLQIRQVVWDNDGAMAEETQDLVILNRKPSADITSPQGKTVETATKMGAVPRIEWVYSDPDQDQQQRYNLVVRDLSGKQVYATGVVDSSKKAILIPESANLQEHVVYSVSVQVYDGYEWSDWSTLKYFYIVRNQPPVAGFNWLPEIIWEGDQIEIFHNVNDTDEDLLSVQYEVKTPDGVIMNYPSENEYYLLHAKQYTSPAFQLFSVIPGTYVIGQIVVDEHGEQAEITKTIKVGELTITGEVLHTEQWEKIRQEYNKNKNRSQWLPSQFLAGESFVLKAYTTDTMDSTTVAEQVKVTFHETKDTTDLVSTSAHNWNGQLWTTSYSKLAKGTYTFIFEVVYSNGVVKTDIVEIEIIGDAQSLSGVHRMQ